MIAAWQGLSPNAKAILLFCSAIFLFSVMDVIGKDLSTRYPPLQVVWGRYASQTFWVFLILAPRLLRLLRTKHFGLQLLRSALLFAATVLFFSGFNAMKLADLVAVFQIAPLCITVLSVVILSEKVGLRRWIGVAAGLVGALIIIRPGTDVFTVYSLLPAAAALCFAGYSIATRFLGDSEDPLTSFLYTALLGAVAASLMMPFVWITPTTTDFAIIGSFGMIGGLGHYCLIIALTYASASVVAPFIYCAVALSAFWGYVVFSEVPDISTYLGALVIVGAGLYVWHRETRAERGS
jgi:drug/metabolite transporter (DMT)-like permease